MDLPVELLITTIAATTFVTFLFKRTHAAAPAKLDKSIVYGVSADFLQRFAIKHNCTTTSYPTFPKGIHPNPPHWWTDGDMIKNTGNVTSAIIVPATTKYAITYIERNDVAYNKDKITGIADVGKANYFVSHAWACSFSSLIDTLVNHTAKLKQEEATKSQTPYYWLDIFCKNQHVVQGDDTAKELTRAVEATGTTLLMCDGSWFTPKCLTRVWCLYEIMWALRLKSDLIVVLPQKKVLKTLSDKFLGQDKHKKMESLDTYLLKAMSSIDVKNSEATVATDKAVILKSIEETVGSQKMSSDISIVLGDAMSLAIKDTVLTIFETDGGITRNKITEIVRNLRVCYRASSFLSLLGWQTQALELTEKAITHFNVVEILGLDGIEPEIKNTTGKDGKSKTIIKFTTTIVRTETVTSGMKAIQSSDEHYLLRELVALYDLYCNLFITTLIKKEDFNKNIIQVRTVVNHLHILLEMQKELLGPNHNGTMGTWTNLANALQRIGFIEEAIHEHKSLLSLRVKQFGEVHKKTLGSLNNLGVNHMVVARKHYKRCQSTWNYEDSTDNAVGCHALALANQEFAAAAVLFQKVVDGREQLYGLYHLETINALRNTGKALVEQHDEQDVHYAYEAAKKCFDTALNRLRSRYGDRHPLTLRATVSFAREMGGESGNDLFGAVALLKSVLGDADDNACIGSRSPLKKNSKDVAKNLIALRNLLEKLSKRIHGLEKKKTTCI